MRKTVYLLKVRAKQGDGIRGLRAWLKRGLRDHGFRCVEIREDTHMEMDARKYATRYIKPDQVRDGPLQTRIINIFEDEKFGRPVLELECGSQFTLNDFNTTTLMKAWGYEMGAWIGKEILLELGTYEDRRDGQQKETVRARAVLPAESDSQSALPAPKTASLKDSLRDKVPF